MGTRDSGSQDTETPGQEATVRHSFHRGTIADLFLVAPCFAASCEVGSLCLVNSGEGSNCLLWLAGARSFLPIENHVVRDPLKFGSSKCWQETTTEKTDIL